MEQEESSGAWSGEGGWVGPGSELEVGSMGDSDSSKDALDHFPIDIGEAIIPARMAEGQAFMIQPHQVQDGGMQVVHVHFVLRCHVAILVGGPIADAGLDATPCQPYGESCLLYTSPSPRDRG